MHSVWIFRTVSGVSVDPHFEHRYGQLCPSYRTVHGGTFWVVVVCDRERLIKWNSYPEYFGDENNLHYELEAVVAVLTHKQFINTKLNQLFTSECDPFHEFV